MGFKLNLNWYDKNTEVSQGEEYSEDLGGDFSVIELLGLSIDYDVNNGSFNVEENWVPIVQKYFSHVIDIYEYNHQISFDYRDEW